MFEEEGDTPATPEGIEPEPTPEAEPEVDPTPELTPEPEPPPAPKQLSPDEIEERAFQRTASWMGRREKELSDSILQNVTKVLDSRLSQFQPAPVAPGTDPATMLENPDQWLRSQMPRVLDEVVGQRTKADQTYMGDFIREAGTMMDSDPLFQGEEGKKLGADVVAEFQKNIGNLDKSMSPGVAARLYLANSTLNVVRQRSSVRQNALSGNRPATGIGTIKAPAAPTVGKPAPVKLDDMAKKVANWFGNSEEDVRNFLK